jgi:hypothetical protein
MLAILLPRLAMVAVNRGAGSVTIGSGLELCERYGRYAFALVLLEEHAPKDEKVRAHRVFRIRSVNVSAGVLALRYFCQG